MIIDAATARRERHADRLAELGEMAMDIARRVHAQLVARTEAAEPGPDAEAAVASLNRTFDRAARSARLSFMLETRLAAAPADPAPPDRWRDEAGEARRQRKAQTRDVVRRVIEAEVSECVRRTYVERLDERLEREHQPDFTWRPLGEMVARISRDLGLAPNWSRWNETWRDDAVAATHRSRSPVRDFAGGTATNPPPDPAAPIPAEVGRDGPS